MSGCRAGGRAQATQKVEKVAGRGSVKMCRGNQLAMISLELYRLPEQPCVHFQGLCALKCPSDKLYVFFLF